MKNNLKLRWGGLFLVPLLLAPSLIQIWLPRVEAARSDTYTYLTLPLRPILEDYAGDSQEQLDIALRAFNDAEEEELLDSGNTTIIGVNCDESSDGGPSGVDICDEYFYPRQIVDGGPFNANPDEVIYFNNLKSLFDGLPYTENVIEVRFETPRRGKVIPLSGADYTVNIQDPHRLSRSLQQICQGREDQPAACDRFREQPEGEDEQDLPSCESANSNVILSWFLCAVINFFDNIVQTMGNIVNDLLQINRAYYTNSNLREAWSYFRNIASFLLIIIGLVMIIGQAMTKG